MEWVNKIEKYKILNITGYRGTTVITPLHQERKCVFWTETIPRGGVQLELGSPAAIDYMQLENAPIFEVASLGEFEVKFFELIKETDQVWYAYQDDCDKMFKIDNINKLDYDLVERLIDEFRIQEVEKRRGIKINIPAKRANTTMTNFEELDFGESQIFQVEASYNNVAFTGIAYEREGANYFEYSYLDGEAHGRWYGIDTVSGQLLYDEWYVNGKVHGEF